MQGGVIYGANRGGKYCGWGKYVPAGDKLSLTQRVTVMPRRNARAGISGCLGWLLIADGAFDLRDHVGYGDQGGA